MKKQTKVLLGALALVVVVVAALFVANPAMLQGKLTSQTGSPMKVVKAGCSDQWGLVFAGNLTPESQGGLLNVEVANTYNNLADMVIAGCDFKAVVKSAAFGNGGTGSFECAHAGAYSGEATFLCNSVKYSSSGEAAYEAYEGVKLNFISGNVYYVPLANQPDPYGNMSFKIYTRK